MYSCLASFVTYIYFIGIDIEYLTQYPSIAVNIYISLFPRSYIFVLVLIIFSLYALEPSSVEKVKLELRPGLPISLERTCKSRHAQALDMDLVQRACAPRLLISSRAGTNRVFFIMRAQRSMSYHLI